MLCCLVINQYCFIVIFFSLYSLSRQLKVHVQLVPHVLALVGAARRVKARQIEHCLVNGLHVWIFHVIEQYLISISIDIVVDIDIVITITIIIDVHIINICIDIIRNVVG